jgi:hypothetical protein
MLPRRPDDVYECPADKPPEGAVEVRIYGYRAAYELLGKPVRCSPQLLVNEFSDNAQQKKPGESSLMGGAHYQVMHQ